MLTTPKGFRRGCFVQEAQPDPLHGLVHCRIRFVGFIGGQYLCEVMVNLCSKGAEMLGECFPGVIPGRCGYSEAADMIGGQIVGLTIIDHLESMFDVTKKNVSFYKLSGSVRRDVVLFDQQIKDS